MLRPSHWPALIALAVALAAGVYADRQDRLVTEQRIRAEVLAELNLIRAKLEGGINGNLQAVRGLVATIATEPDMDQERYARLASQLFRGDSQLRNIAGAPDLVVSLMYPLFGNERAIGLDYRTNPAQIASAERARDTRELVLAGPVDLVQGGQGFIGRFPVYTSGTGDFWGIVSAVIDIERLYRYSGLLEPNLSVDVAITGRDGTKVDPTPFFGSLNTVADRPMRAEVALPSGAWQLAAVPRGGWAARPTHSVALRLAILLAGALVVGPLLFAGNLLDERQRHIARLRVREAEYAKLSKRFGMALDISHVGVWEYDLSSRKLFWDDRMNELYGVPAVRRGQELDHWRAALHPDDLQRADMEFNAAIAALGRYESQFRVVHPDGAIRHIRAVGAVYEEAGANPKIVGLNWDVTADILLTQDLLLAKSATEARNAELESARARIEHNALHDSLTALPNRRYLDEVLEFHAARCERTGTGFALLHIDLDRFKQINDTLGHAAGDAMLVHAARMLSANVREDDFVARIGGDEFVIVCAAPGAATELSALAERLIARMRQPITFEGHECRCSVSVGIASAEGPATDPKRLLINADIALYRAKNRGRDRYEFFTEALQAEVVNTKRIADEILNGIEADEFIAFYQPQFDAKTLDIVGAEALVRWRHPLDGVLTPNIFLPIAEDLNVVATIDRTVLGKALADLRRWQAMGHPIPKVSVNVSASRLADENLIESLVALDIEPGTVSFELVESIYLDESDDVAAFNIDRIRDMGIDLEIDDFGTGYASILSLMKLRPKRLKIDRQLVFPVVESAAQRHLVASMIDIGKSLGIEVVAEGVETMAHAEILRDLGCNVLQGFALARPMSAEQLDVFVRRNSWRAAS